MIKIKSEKRIKEILKEEAKRMARELEKKGYKVVEVYGERVDRSTHKRAR